MKSINGYENYCIDSIGNVFNVKTNRRLKTSKQSSGYCQIVLSHKNKQKSFLVHRLIAQNYIPNINNLPCVNHINGIKTDNRVDNLEWISYSDNHKHAFKLGLKKPPKHKEKVIIDLSNGNKYNSATQLAIIIGVDKQWLINRLNGRTKNLTSYSYI